MRRILLVHPEYEARVALATALAASGYLVSSAAGHAHALYALRFGPPPDLVVIVDALRDIAEELVGSMRAEPALAPLDVLTLDPDDAAGSSARDAGPERLVEAVRKILQP